MEVLIEIFLLCNFCVRQGGVGSICQIPFKNHKLKVKSYYKVLTFNIYLWVFLFPWKSIWRVEAPSKVTFVLWMMALGKILTLDSIRKQIIIVANWYCMCKKNVKSMDHFLHCEVVRDLWYLTFEIYGSLVYFLCTGICLHFL